MAFIRLFTILSLLLINCNISFSQGRTLPTAMIAPFTHTPEVSTKDADQITRMVNSYVSTANRFRLVDRENQKAVNAELDRQMDEIYLDGYMVEQGVALGAKYMIIGHVISISPSHNYASIQIGVVDIATSQTIASEVLTPTGRKAANAIAVTDKTENVLGTNNTSSNGVNLLDMGKIAFNTITSKTLEKNVNSFLNEYFPQQFLITSMEESGSGVTMVELYGSKNHKFKKGETFRAVEIISRQNPDGTVGTQQKAIATMKVAVVEGDYAQCKVSKKEQAALLNKKDAEGLTIIK